MVRVGISRDFLQLLPFQKRHHGRAIFKSAGSSYDPEIENFLTNPLQDGPDRRQSPRIRCGGLAEIITLPSVGLVVPGKVLNLSLGGCGVETLYTVAPGTRAEILLHVNTASIRVLAEVQVPRQRHVVGVEFLRVSAFGKNLLEDLIRELATRQAEYNSLKVRRQRDDQTLRSMAGSFGNMAAQATALSLQQSILGPVRPATAKVATILNGDEIDVFI